MGRIKRARPSPALVISIVAMFAALGGGAFAATATTSKQAVNNKGNLNKNVVKKKNIANGAVVTKKLKDGKVTGSKLSDESVSASKLGSITTVTDSSNITFGPSGGTATATCPPGSKVIGGGWEGSPPSGGINVVPHVDKKSGNGWTASASLVTSNGAGGPRTLTAYAYCLDSNG